MRTLPWMVEAERLKGIKEIPGPKSNATIMSWAKALGVSSTYTNDDISWCGLFIGWVFLKTLPTEKRPANILGARQWLKFGKPVTPKFGSVLVFWRGSKSGWQGHVGLYVGEDAEAYHVLGGNQSDTVNVTRIAKNRLLGARWPSSVSDADVGVVKAVGSTGLSQNEA